MNNATAEFDFQAAMQAAYDSAQVEDDDRTLANECLGRDVIAELSAAFPYKSSDDESVKLPIRITWNGDDGIVLEVGPYDFDGSSAKLLQQAIAHFHYYGGEW